MDFCRSKWLLSTSTAVYTRRRLLIAKNTYLFNRRRYIKYSSMQRLPSVERRLLQPPYCRMPPQTPANPDQAGWLQRRHGNHSPAATRLDFSLNCCLNYYIMKKYHFRRSGHMCAVVLFKIYSKLFVRTYANCSLLSRKTNVFASSRWIIRRWCSVALKDAPKTLNL